MKFLLAAVLIAVALSAGAPASADGFLKTEGTKLLLDGKEYRAIGANVPHLSAGYMGKWPRTNQKIEEARQSIVDAVVDAAENKVAFIRFFAGAGKPDPDAVDSEEYWGQMGEVFDLCRQHNIKLVPVLGVLGAAQPGESKRALLDPESESYRFIHAYANEFVSRYKDDPTVLMWELSNEIFHFADLNLGTIKLRSGRTTFEDSLTTDMLLDLCKEMTEYIKSIDPNHPVTTGDAGPRDCSMSLRKSFPEMVWEVDTLRQHLSSLLLQQAEPLDVFSLHANGGSFTSETKVGSLSSLEFLRCRIRAAHSTLTPVYIGEFSQGQPHFKDDPEARWACVAIDMIEEEGVALTAIWVWHFRWQNKNWNIKHSNTQPVLMKRVAEFNEKYAGL
jgi:hypothetical protein